MTKKPIEPTLPPLPNPVMTAAVPYYDGRDQFFTADQMDAYARAAITKKLNHVDLPTAYMDANGNLFSVGSHEKFGYGSIPLYTSPQAAQPEQPATITHDDWYAKCNLVEALQDKVYALEAKCEVLTEMLKASQQQPPPVYQPRFQPYGYIW